MLSPVPQGGQGTAGTDVCWQLTPGSSRAELVSLEARWALVTHLLGEI